MAVFRVRSGFDLKKLKHEARIVVRSNKCPLALAAHQHMFVDMYEGKIKGFLADGQNPAVGGPNAKLARAAMEKRYGNTRRDDAWVPMAVAWLIMGLALVGPWLYRRKGAL